MASFRSLALSVAVVGGLLAARSASASLVIALDLPAMVGRADHVAVVDVVSVKAAWDPRHEKILTTIDLAVVETWKGSAAPASHFTIVQRGGTVDDTSMVVYGMPTFAPGERAVVFLEGEPGHGRVVGMAQGKRLVRREVGSGRWVVHAPDKAGALFIRTTPAGATAPVFEIHARPIEELRAEVKALLVAPAPVKGR
jgi:hypothetical protein